MRHSGYLQFLRFSVVGAANTVVGVAIIYAGKWFFNLDDVAANAIGYSVGLVVSFSLNSRWTFEYLGPRFPAIGKFLIAALVAYATNLLTVMVAINHYGVNGYGAQAMGVPIYTLTFYFCSKYLVFHPKTERNGREP